MNIMFERIVRWIRRQFPEIDCDVGTAVHFIYGFLAPVLGSLVGTREAETRGGDMTGVDA